MRLRVLKASWLLPRMQMTALFQYRMTNPGEFWAALVGLPAMWVATWWAIFRVGNVTHAKNPYVLAVFFSGETVGLLIVAMLHAAIALALIGPLAFHMEHTLFNSQCVRVFHHRLRHAPLLAVVVTVEALVFAILAIDVAMGPLLWKPFARHLSLRGWTTLLELHVLLCGIVVAAATLVLALRIRLKRFEYGTLLTWILMLSFYAGVILMARSVIERFKKINIDAALQNAGEFVRILKYAVDGEHHTHIVALAVCMWACVWFLLRPFLARSIGKWSLDPTPQFTGLTLARAHVLTEEPPPRSSAERRRRGNKRLLFEELRNLIANPGLVLFWFSWSVYAGLVCYVLSRRDDPVLPPLVNMLLGMLALLVATSGLFFAGTVIQQPASVLLWIERGVLRKRSIIYMGVSALAVGACVMPGFVMLVLFAGLSPPCAVLGWMSTVLGAIGALAIATGVTSLVIHRGTKGMGRVVTLWASASLFGLLTLAAIPLISRTSAPAGKALVTLAFSGLFATVGIALFMSCCRRIPRREASSIPVNPRVSAAHSPP